MSGDINGLIYGSTDYSTDGSSVGTLVDSSVGLNDGTAFSIPKSQDTATSNAIQSMTPNTSSGSVASSDWSGFWQGVLGSAIKTGEQVALANNGNAAATAAPSATVTAPAAPRASALTLLLLVAVVALVATHKG